MDQQAAQLVGHKTRFPSLELGCEEGRGAGNCDSGYSCAYSSNVAWSSESNPVGKETNPRLVFERLFSDRPSKQDKSDKDLERRQILRKSILDFVSDDAKRLQKKLGGNDRKKIDEYLNGVREIERRVEMAEKEAASGVTEEVLGHVSPTGKPKDYGEHIRLMFDMMTLAFQTDSTRISTFMLANAGSNRAVIEKDIIN